MDMFRDRSPFFYMFVTFIIFLIVIEILAELDLNLAIVAIGLVGSVGLLTGSFFLTSEWRCERFMFRFLALQSACVGLYLWGVGLKLADVREWIVGFIVIIFVLLPLALILVLWLVKKDK